MAAGDRTASVVSAPLVAPARTVNAESPRTSRASPRSQRPVAVDVGGRAAGRSNASPRRREETHAERTPRVSRAGARPIQAGPGRDEGPDRTRTQRHSILQRRAVAE